MSKVFDLLKQSILEAGRLLREAHIQESSAVEILTFDAYYSGLPI